MKTAWNKGCKNEGEKADRLSLFNQSAQLRKVMVTLLHAKIDDADKAGRSKEGYDCPNWAYKQADTQGYKRAMSEILSLIS